MAKRFNEETSLQDILKEFIQVNKLDAGMDKVDVEQAWKNLMGNGVNNYTEEVLLKKETLYRLQLQHSGRNHREPQKRKECGATGGIHRKATSGCAAQLLFGSRTRYTRPLCGSIRIHYQLRTGMVLLPGGEMQQAIQSFSHWFGRYSARILETHPQAQNR